MYLGLGQMYTVIAAAIFAPRCAAAALPRQRLEFMYIGKKDHGCRAGAYGAVAFLLCSKMRRTQSNPAATPVPTPISNTVANSIADPYAEACFT